MCAAQRRQRRPCFLWIGVVLSTVFFCTSVRLTLYASELTGWSPVDTYNSQLANFVRSTRDPTLVHKFSTSDEGLQPNSSQKSHNMPPIALGDHLSSSDPSINSEPTIMPHSLKVESSAAQHPPTPSITNKDMTEPTLVASMMSSRNNKSFTGSAQLDVADRSAMKALYPFGLKQTPVASVQMFETQLSGTNDAMALAEAAALLPLPHLPQPEKWFPQAFTSKQSGIVDSTAVRELKLPLDFLAFENALLYGDVHGQTETKDDLLERIRKASQLWLVLLQDYVETEMFAMLWFGCFDGPEPPLAPMVLAAERPQASIAIIHACRGHANTSVLVAMREKLELANVIVLSPHYAPTWQTRDDDTDDDVPFAWQASRSDDAILQLSDCDLLVVSPGAISVLLSALLPPDAEISLSRALQWCSKSLFIDDVRDIQQQQYIKYWAVLRELINAAIARIHSNNCTYSVACPQPTWPRPSLWPGKKISGRLVVVSRNSSSCSRAGSEHYLEHVFRVRVLHKLFGFSDCEGVNILATALRRGSFVACAVAYPSINVSYGAGALRGCNVEQILLRRGRFRSIITSKQHRRLFNPDKRNHSLQFMSSSQIAASRNHMRNLGSIVRFQTKPDQDLKSEGSHGNLVEKAEQSPLQELAKFAEEEGAALKRWWPRVKGILRERTHPFTALVIGEDLGMLALRLARKHMLSTIVVQRNTKLATLEALATTIGINNVITASEFYNPTLSTLGSRAGQGTFFFVLLGASTMTKYLARSCVSRDFERQVGVILTRASSVALIELPRFRMLERALEAMHARSCASNIREAYKGNELEFLKESLRSANETRSVTLELMSSRRLFAPQDAPNNNLGIAPAEESIFFKLTFPGSVRTDHIRETADSGSVSISALLDAGVTPRWRSLFLQSYLELPLWRMTPIASKVPTMIEQALSPSGLRFGPDPIAMQGIDFRADVRMFGDSLRAGFSPQVTVSPPLILLTPYLDDLMRMQRPCYNETMWCALRAFLLNTPAEHRNGRFSLFEWGGAKESLALKVAQSFPNATVVSIAGDHIEAGLQIHTASASYGNVVACAGVKLDRRLATHVYESPELARYSFLALEDDLGTTLRRRSALLIASLSENSEYSDIKEMVGALISSSLTTFLPVPSAAHVSLAMMTFFGQDIHPGGGLHSTFSHRLASPYLTQFEAEIIRRLVVVPSSAVGDTSLAVSGSKPMIDHALIPPPLIRVDITNITRPVHHHFDWARDGHKRTYTMRISVNKTASLIAGRNLRGSRMVDSHMIDDVSGGGKLQLNANGYVKLVDLPIGHHVSNDKIVHVRLVRDEDHSYIPYGTIQSVTLIAALRLGLVTPQRKKTLSAFVKLPLYEDMAPWNIAFKAASLDYIDYDTRLTTYDAHVSKIYRVLSVLMNYKRTVQDLGMCGPKAKTPYGFILVSDCVKPTSFEGVCESDSSVPVPCDDGQCHSDFISCLRAITAKRGVYNERLQPNKKVLQLSPNQAGREVHMSRRSRAGSSAL